MALVIGQVEIAAVTPESSPIIRRVPSKWALAAAMGRSGLFEAILLDGNFVTAKGTPNDIDLIPVLPPDHNFERDLAMPEYALVSRPLLKRRFGVDAVLARRDSPLYHTYVEFFSRVREAPQLRKGLLRMR